MRSFVRCIRFFRCFRFFRSIGLVGALGEVFLRGFVSRDRRRGFFLFGRELSMIAQVVEGLALHALMGEQVLGHGDQHVGVTAQDLLAPGGRLVENALDLLVDDACGLLAVALGLAGCRCR